VRTVSQPTEPPRQAVVGLLLAICYFHSFSIFSTVILRPTFEGHKQKIGEGYPEFFFLWSFETEFVPSNFNSLTELNQVFDEFL